MPRLHYKHEKSISLTDARDMGLEIFYAIRRRDPHLSVNACNWWWPDIGWCVVPMLFNYEDDARQFMQEAIDEDIIDDAIVVPAFAPLRKSKENVDVTGKIK